MGWAGLGAIRFDLPMRHLLRRFLGLLAALVPVSRRALLRIRVVDDPRPVF